MDSAGELVISRIQSSDLTGLHHLFAAHLRPLSSFSGDPKPRNGRNRPTDSQNSTTIRSLAKQFLPFVSRALSLLGKRLSGPPASTGDAALELFDSYRLCLKCLDLMSPLLESKPHEVHYYRVSMIHYLQKWERFEEAAVEGFTFLERLRSTDLSSISRNHYLPRLDTAATVDPEFASLVLKVVVTLVKCAASPAERKNPETYSRVLALLFEATPWFRVLHVQKYKQLHSDLMKHLDKIVIFLVSDLQFLDRGLLTELLRATLIEYSGSPLENKMFEFARRVCTCLFAQKDDANACIGDLVVCVLDTVAHECKLHNLGQVSNNMMAHIKFVGYCANECANKCATDTSLCDAVAEQLQKSSVDLQDSLPFGKILGLYASGIFISTCMNLPTRFRSMCSGSLNEESAPLQTENTYEKISAMVHALNSYFHISIQEQSLAVAVGPTALLVGSEYEASTTNNHTCRKDHTLCYMDALAFLFQKLSKLVKLNREQILGKDEDIPFRNWICNIQYVFNEFFDVSLSFYSSVKRSDGCNMTKTLLNVAVAAYTLALGTKLDMQEAGVMSEDFFRHLVSSSLIDLQGVKNLFSCIYNIGATLNQNKQLNEASMAFELYYTASWYCVSLLGDKKGICGDLSESLVVEFVDEVFLNCAHVLGLLYACCSHNLKKIVVDSLGNWLVAGKLCKSLQRLAPLVKQWVKINCKLYKDFDMGGTVQTLYSEFVSLNASESTIGVILELELQAYEEINGLSSKFYWGMQLKIVDILLKKVYHEKDTVMQKSGILIRKGRLLRAQGIGGLPECIDCLSQAISLIDDMFSQESLLPIPVRYRLGVAYCLRALCQQEGNPSSKRIFQDIQKAINLWLTMPIEGDNSLFYDSDIVSENTMLLLYHMFDLLAVKGCTQFHNDIHKLIIKFSKFKHAALEKILPSLWESRRLSHALCFSPINNACIMSLLKHYGDVSMSKDFWVESVRGSEPLCVGLQQHFSLSSTHAAQGTSYSGFLSSDVCFTEVKEVALGLLSSGLKSTRSVFLASYLYYEMCERLISNGQFIEALQYAKESFQLRNKLLHEKFTYELQDKMHDESSKLIQKSSFGLSKLQISDSVATGVWSFPNVRWNLDSFILTPWNVLQCYLESTLQVAIIQEALGDESAAEVLLLSGKNVSHLQGLSLFFVSFSSVLGKLYRKKQHWDMAKKEFDVAEKVLADIDAVISCSACLLVFKTNMYQQLVDLYRCTGETTVGSSFSKSLSSALKNLNRFELKCFANCPENGRYNAVVADNIRMTRSRSTKFKQKIALQACACLKSGAVFNFIRLRWELICRRTSLKSLTSLGKFSAYCGEVIKMDELCLKAITVLYSRNAFFGGSSSDSLVPLLDLIGKNIPGDLLLVERAAIIYCICWFFLTNHNSKDVRVKCCLLSHIKLQKIVHWLMVAFTLSREVPLLFRKISRLLVVVIIYLSSSDPSFSLFSGNALSANHWAAYFHQASLSTHLNHQLLTSVTNKQRVQPAADVKCPEVGGFPPPGAGKNNILRHVPASFEDIGRSVMEFFQCLPCTTMICISLHGDAYADLIRELISSPASVKAWMLISRINQKTQPIVLLSPVSSISEEVFDGGSTSKLGSPLENSDKQWHCPWGSTIVDDVAPIYRKILAKNYLSSSTIPEPDTKRTRSLWWNRRKELDEQLAKFLRDVEDSWFGPWKFLLLGELSDSSFLDAVNKLIHDLKSRCRVDVNEGALGIVLRSIKLVFQKAFLSEVLLRKGSYIGEFQGEATGASCSMSNVVNQLPDSACDLILEVANQLNEKDSHLRREPVILVLDRDIQMLPWENIPILRNEEVYRMPSVGSVSAIIDKYHQRQAEMRVSAEFPLVDPKDAFYLLNPSGDLSHTQVEFENWCENHNLEGKAGIEPTNEELATALKYHDLFMYFGHGSGAQYITGHEIQKLDKCAATLLMGCSSGSLSVSGCYLQRGTPLCYLRAGSPFVVANLWEVTDKDIDRFSKALLDAWMEERMKERSVNSRECGHCKSVTEGLKSLNINKRIGKSKEKMSNKLVESCENVNCRYCVHCKPKIASFMGKAREACNLRFLVGASPVCYGVPTAIWKKDL